jgi:hypothetical protein
VFKLRKALYGLRQAPRAWNTKLDNSLKELGFVCSPSVHAMYARGHGDSRLLLGVYVDDPIVAGADVKEIARFKQEMMDRFWMSNLGLLHFYLGIELCQNAHNIILSQAGYAGRLLERTGMAECNPTHVPVEPKLKLSKQSKAPATALDLLPECCRVSALLGAHQTRHCIRRRLRQQVHGGTYDRASCCCQTPAALHRWHAQA